MERKRLTLESFSKHILFCHLQCAVRNSNLMFGLTPAVETFGDARVVTRSALPMKVLHGLATLLWQEIQRMTLLAVCILVACGVARAQAAVEYAGATSIAARAASSAKPPSWTVTLPRTSSTGASLTSKTATYLTIPAGPPPDVVNRHALEEKAGKDAGRLLLRSIPTGARVWMNGKFVGTTPILLILPPGKYRVEFRGQRLESGEEDIGLLPHETREIAVSLEARYPTQVSIR